MVVGERGGVKHENTVTSMQSTDNSLTTEFDCDHAEMVFFAHGSVGTNQIFNRHDQVNQLSLTLNEIN